MLGQHSLDRFLRRNSTVAIRKGESLSQAVGPVDKKISKYSGRAAILSQLQAQSFYGLVYAQWLGHCVYMCCIVLGFHRRYRLLGATVPLQVRSLFHFWDMSPKVDQISSVVFSENNTQASSSHSLSTHLQHICNVNERQHTSYFIW